MSHCVLIADDDAGIRTVLSQALSQKGYEVRLAGNASALWQLVTSGQGDIVVTDIVMPDENTFNLLPQIKKHRPDLPIIVMSAHNSFLTAVRASEHGVYDYLPKPFDLNEVIGAVDRALSSQSAEHALPQDNAENLPLIGRSPAMQEIYRLIARLLPTDLTILIFGESGTGKELVARALHDYGQRKNGPFVALNMAAIPRDLIESELFGHEKGAFTGAQSRRLGRFEQAEGGTLFLDEIGDMPMEAQTRLLRVLQEGEYTTVGGRSALRANVRIIAATNRNLHKLVEKHQFREDLFFRLNVVPLKIPPLRERAEDIPELLRHFLSLTAKAGHAAKMVDMEAIDLLQAYDWPGNVRELENLARRFNVLYPQDVIAAPVVRYELQNRGQSSFTGKGEKLSFTALLETQIETLLAANVSNLHEHMMAEIEKPLISKVLAATAGNQLKAAKILGLNRNTLRKKIRELGL